MNWSDARSWWAAGLVGALGAALVATMARGVIGHIPLYDELLHILSARGLLSEGAPIIADGIYSRAWLYTSLVAASIAGFGDTLVVARLPSLVAAGLLAVVLGVWVVRRAGLAAGLGAVVALCLIPETLKVAVFVRFYTLHALLVLCMGLLAFAAVGQGVRPAWRAGYVIAALLLLPLAWHLQPTTAIAFGAIMLAAAVVLTIDHWQWVSRVLSVRPLTSIAAALILGALAVLGLFRLGFIDALREVPVWAAWAADMKHFYVVTFAREMPLLWPLFPAAVVLSFLVDRRLTAFCIVAFAAAFLVHSLAAAKQMRYIFYVFPFMSVLLGLGAAGALRMATEVSQRYAVLGVLVAALVLSSEGQLMAKLALGRASMQEALPYTVEPDWAPIAGQLRAAAERADRVITSNSMKSIYYLGRYDYELNASIVAETDTGGDFGIDSRTGGKAIASAEAVRWVLSEPGTSLVVLEVETMNNDRGVSRAAEEALRALCEEVVLPPESGLAVWQCSASR